MKSMGSESFYATAAQVLPTLLIAVIIELVSHFRESAVILNRIDERLEDPRLNAIHGDAMRRKHKEYDRSVFAYFAGAALFIVAELAAVTVLFIGTKTWISWLAAPLIAVAIIAMCLAAFAAPLLRAG